MRKINLILFILSGFSIISLTSYLYESYRRGVIINRYDTFSTEREFDFTSEAPLCFSHDDFEDYVYLLRIKLPSNSSKSRNFNVNYRVDAGKEYFCDFSRSYDLEWWNKDGGMIYFPLYSFKCALEVCISSSQSGSISFLIPEGRMNLYFISSRRSNSFDN